MLEASVNYTEAAKTCARELAFIGSRCLLSSRCLMLSPIASFHLCSLSKRSFSSPGGVVRDLGICARELASIVSRCLPLSPVVSRCLPLSRVVGFQPYSLNKRNFRNHGGVVGDLGYTGRKLCDWKRA